MAGPKIVLGLGNPGSRYRRTRHNLGFRVVELLAERHGESLPVAWDDEPDVGTTRVRVHGHPLVLARPRTFMNRSGRAALSVLLRYAANPDELLVIYDDADLELGRLRLRASGGAGGHNGLRSLIDALGTEQFPRLRLGVRGPGRESADLADYVLRPFEPDEEPIAEALADGAVEAVEAVVERGLAAAMNSYNARFVSRDDETNRSEEEG